VKTMIRGRIWKLPLILVTTIKYLCFLSSYLVGAVPLHSSPFGQEREGYLQGILGSIDQTFDGEDLYP
jgi:hypothetical protein